MYSQHKSSGNPTSYLRSTVILFLFFLCSELIAGFVTLQDAKTVAHIAWKRQNLMTLNPYLGETILAEPLTIMAGKRIAWYVFNVNDDKGFVIVAADDRMPPVLGYSFEGAYDPSDLAPGFRWFLDDKLRQADEILAREDVALPQLQKEWNLFSEESLPLKRTEQSVDPLIKTKWNQGCYYNDSCPPSPSSSYCYHTPTGCGATAMAQFIRYWEFPPYGLGNDYYEHDGDTLHADFSLARYNYDSMSIHPDCTNPEIARLMYHCGVSVHMNYGTYASSCDLSSFFSALDKQFCYSTPLWWKFRKDVDSAQWETMLRGELDLGHPLIYYGCDGGTCHLFLCDGYQDPPYFHFNWGWGGMDDGYFYLNNLSPDWYYNFTADQGAIFNMVPGILPSPGWDTLGSPGFSQPDSYFGGIRVSSAGQPHLASRSLHSDNLDVLKFTGSEWETVGDTPVVCSWLSSGFVLDRRDIPYLLYSDTSYAPAVSRLEGNQWTLLGSRPIAGNGQQMDITLDAFDNPYVSMVSYVDGQMNGFFYRFINGAWEELGNAPFSSGTGCVEWTKIAIDSSGKVYVLWYDCTSPGHSNVSKFDGISWSLVDDKPIDSLFTSLESSIVIGDKNTVYVSLSAGSRTRVYRLDPGGWTVILGEAEGYPARYPNLAADNSGNVLLAYADPDRLNLGSVMKYHNGEWIPEGPAGFTPGKTEDCKVAFYRDGNIYFAYIDHSRENRVTVQHYIDISIGIPERIVRPRTVSVYPNPCYDGRIYIHGDHLYSGDYNLVDPLGRIVFSGNLENRDDCTDIILHLPSSFTGIYFLQIRAGDSVHAVKLVLY